MRILITNVLLWPRTGTVMFVRDLALGLRRRGMSPAVYSLATGPVCDQLRSAGVPVVSRLRDLPWVPEIIHGHHADLIRIALQTFRGVPAVTVCHDHLSPHDQAVLDPAVQRHLAVSELCLERQLAEGVRRDATSLLPNFVDMDRFRPRGPLPRRPRRALVFSNYATDGPHLQTIRDTCARARLSLDVVGSGVGTATDSPEDVLPEYDVVFAKARAALEAMAVGTAVILCDYGASGPLVQSTAFDALQRQNFGRAAIASPLTIDALLRELARYDPADVLRVQERVRQQASLDVVLDTLVATYADCLGKGTSARWPSARQRLEVARAHLAIRAFWGWTTMPPRRQAWLRATGLNLLCRTWLLPRRLSRPR